MDIKKKLASMGVRNGRVVGENEIFNLADIIRNFISGGARTIMQNIGQNSQVSDVSQGIGLGIRQHDDVMLAWGLTKVVQHEVSIEPNEYVLIELTVPVGATHHAEGRFLESFNEHCEFWVIPNYEGSVPVSGVNMTIWNEKGPYIDGNLSTFQYWDPQLTLPIDFDPALDINRDKWIGHADLRGSTGQGVRASSADRFIGLVGRHYDPGRHMALTKNVGVDTAKFTYQYRWHDFE